MDYEGKVAVEVIAGEPAVWEPRAIPAVVFTDHEVRRLAAAAGLRIEERIVVDYDSGKVRRFAFEGNLLYVFHRSSRIDSSRAPHTS